MKIEEQDRVLRNTKQNMIVSASAGSGKTYVLIEYICQLVCKKRVPIKKLLILTFTKAAANEMKERLIKSLKEEKMDDFILKQIDDLSVSNISTIHAFCEYCLKKYANILKIKENFDVADENLAMKIKLTSLKRAIKTFEDEMFPIRFAFKYDDKKLFDAIFELENMLFAVADKQKFLEKIGNEKMFEEAEKIVCEYIDKEFKDYADALEERHFNDMAFIVRQNSLGIFSARTILEKIENVANFTFPKFPKKSEITFEEGVFLDKLKEDLKKFKEKLDNLSLDKERIAEEKNGDLEKAILKLFLEYQKEYQHEKQNLNLLDFNDLEQFMTTLTNLDSFNESFEYIFIDEYQDTNALQEKIIKKVAKDHNFIAVGDAKQGIYGFRLASSKIFLRDIDNFSADENSCALYLKSNFRSDKKLLNFVNDVFKDTMTKDIAGLDYFPNSMFEGVFDFENDGKKAIKIDLVPAKERKEKDFGIYSVKDDELEDGTNRNELEVVRARIEEIVKSRIFDNKLGVMRQATYSDIAILSRSRNSFFNELGRFLLQSGIPVTTSSKKKLLETPEIKVLLNYLKIALSMRDNIALLSVLMSNFGRFNQNEISQIILDEEKNLFEIVKNNEKFSNFLKNLENFRSDGLALGYRRAFENLFDRTNYFSYLFSQYNGEELLASVNLFLESIEKSTFTFDLPNLIAYFENVDIEDSGQELGEKNAVLLTTIHKTKGLEYPVVILINAGKDLRKADKKGEIRVDEDLGLATKFYEEDNEYPTVKMFAMDIKNERKRLTEEMMIFYVALTRAKNRVYIIGESGLKNLKPLGVEKFNSYFDYIFSLLKTDEIEKFIDEGFFSKGDIEFNIISEVENLEVEKNEIKYGKIDEKIAKNVEKYLNFQYFFKNNENISFKNSVTSLTKKHEESSAFQKNYEFINTNSSFVEIGNAYHLALKVLNFNEINSVEDVQRELNKPIFDESRNLIDAQLIFKNISTLKPFAVNENRVFKEKEFVMKDSITNLIDKDCKDEIMVQGIVDFFAVQKNGSVVLIDYKFSGEKNPDILVNRYKLQLKLYKNAIENGLNLRVEKVFLLNLKYNNLIEINLF